MRPLAKTTGLLLILFSFVGCIQVDTLVKIKPDGSGTIEETFLMRKEVVNLMQGMAQQIGGSTEDRNRASEDTSATPLPGRFDIFDEAKLKNEAGKRGYGVTYVKGHRITTDGFEGYKAIYAFSDINKLQLNQNPSESVPSATNAQNKASEKKQEFVTFHFTKGKPSTLMVKLPAHEGDGEHQTTEKRIPAKADNRQAEAAMAQMKKMFEGMKITMAFEIQGSIVHTNATHREGSKITMMQLDFDKLLQMPEKMNMFSQAQPQSLEAAKALMKDLPGIKVELNKEVIITFK